MNEQDFETQLEAQIKVCEESVKTAIERSLKWQRRRALLSSVQAGLQLLFACLKFYKRHYIGGIIDCLTAEAIAAWTWWCLTKPVKANRMFRAEWAQIKRDSERVLAEWRGYK